MAVAPRFRPRGQQDLAPAGETAKARANLAALEVLATVRAQNRPASAAEQAVLGRWSAWGALPDVFDEKATRLGAERDAVRAVLSEQDWRAARRTTPNAHYTDATLVQAGWDLLTGLGFTGGRVLEPGCGSGNWIGLAPPSTQMVGVELDPTSAAIASLLYPDATIHTDGFERTTFPSGSFDAVVGNVPFGDYPVFDPVHNPDGFAIHNAFLVKSLRLVKPGGLVVAITSTWTMDAQDAAARRAMQAEADLLGAIRLPSGAHQAAAGTRVATDLLVLRRRREGEEPAPFDWDSTVMVELPEASHDRLPEAVERSDDGVPLVRINRFFAENPAAVLGRLALGGIHTTTLMVLDDTDRWQAGLAVQARELVRRAEASHGTHGPVAWPGPPEPAEVAAGDDLPAMQAEAGSLAVADDGSLVRLRPDGTGKPVATSSRAQERELRALVELLADTRTVLATQADATANEVTWRAAQARLDNHYDAYAARYGRLSDTTVVRDGVDPDSGKPLTARQPRVPRPILTDPGWALLAALEVVNSATGEVTKAPIFTERVISPHRIPTGADTAAEALAASLAVHGEVNLDYIAGLLALDADAAEAELADLVYRNPVGGELETAQLYLSGNVRAKLGVARDAAARDPRWARQVAALEAVQPEDLTPGEISARLGAPWIPADDIAAFIVDLLDTTADTVEVEHSTKTATWKVKAPTNLAARTDWGTERVNARRLLDQALNLTPTRVYDVFDEGDREVRVLNVAETAAAQDKRNAIEARFAEWVWEDPARATRLARIYNDRFNNLRLPTFDGSHLTFPGMAATFTPHPHQRDGAWRVVCGGMPGTGGNVLLGHVVGAGKTATMVMAGMEMRRLGLVNKPMYVVPNHMLEQFAREFVQLYPLAKVLVATKADLARGARQAFAARCATGNWDAVVITHASFSRLPVSPAVEHDYVEAEIAAYTAALESARAENTESFTVKELEKKLRRFEVRQETLKAQRDAARDTGAAVYFEDLGVDYLFGDEAQKWKGRPVASRVPTGIATSTIASDMAMKLDYLRATHGERIACFATGTPIANTLTEAWVLTRNLAPAILEDAGVAEFDAWAGTYTESVTALEMAPEGGRMRMNTRPAARFQNVSDLFRQFRAFADLKTAADLDLPRPSLAGGAPRTVVLPASAELQEYIASLGERADAVRAKTVPPEEDNMLLISGHGRKASLSLELVGLAADPAGGKAERVAIDVAQIWAEHRHRRYLIDPEHPEAGYQTLPGALQVVFCDLGTPNTDGRYAFYDDLRTRLVAQGIPAEQIAYVHGAGTDTAKAKLFARCRDGQIAVLIGSTEKMGVGTNVQSRLIALHHVDVPWRPMDIEQRDGRILRQGNQNPEIHIRRYVGEGSFDAYMWQTVERKAAGYAALMRGDTSIRTLDMGDDQALDYGQVKALATGNPDIIRLTELDNTISRLRDQRAAHEREQNRLGVAQADAENRVAALDLRIGVLDDLIPRRRDTRGEKFVATVDGQVYRDREAAGLAVLDTVRRSPARNRPFGVGELGGLAIRAARDWNGRTWLFVDGLVAAEGRNLGFDISPTGIPLGPLMSGLEAQIRGLDDRRARIVTDRDEAQADVDGARARLGRPWPGSDDLAAAIAERATLAASLTVDDPPTVSPGAAAAADGDTPTPSAQTQADPPTGTDRGAEPATDRAPSDEDTSPDPDTVLVQLGSTRNQPDQPLWVLRAGETIQPPRIRIAVADEELRAKWIEAFTGIPAGAPWRAGPIPNSQLLRVHRDTLPPPDSIVAVVWASSDSEQWTLHDVTRVPQQNSRGLPQDITQEILRGVCTARPEPAGHRQWLRCDLVHLDGDLAVAHYADVRWDETTVRAVISDKPGGDIMASIVDTRDRLFPPRSAISAAFPGGTPQPGAAPAHPNGAAVRPQAVTAETRPRQVR